MKGVKTQAERVSERAKRGGEKKTENAKTIKPKQTVSRERKENGAKAKMAMCCKGRSTASTASDERRERE